MKWEYPLRLTHLYLLNESSNHYRFLFQFFLELHLFAIFWPPPSFLGILWFFACSLQLFAWLHCFLQIKDFFRLATFRRKTNLLIFTFFLHAQKYFKKLINKLPIIQNNDKNVKFRHRKKAIRFKKISDWFWNLLSSVRVSGLFFKFLWLFQKIRFLKTNVKPSVFIIKLLIHSVHSLFKS